MVQPRLLMPSRVLGVYVVYKFRASTASGSSSTGSEAPCSIAEVTEWNGLTSVPGHLESRVRYALTQAISRGPRRISFIRANCQLVSGAIYLRYGIIVRGSHCSHFALSRVAGSEGLKEGRHACLLRSMLFGVYCCCIIPLNIQSLRRCVSRDLAIRLVLPQLTTRHLATYVHHGAKTSCNRQNPAHEELCVVPSEEGRPEVLRWGMG